MSSKQDLPAGCSKQNLPVKTENSKGASGSGPQDISKHKVKCKICGADIISNDETKVNSPASDWEKGCTLKKGWEFVGIHYSVGSNGHACIDCQYNCQAFGLQTGKFRKRPVPVFAGPDNA